MGKTNSPPRSPRGSPLVRRHPSPTTDRYPVIHSSSQRLPERSNTSTSLAAAATTVGISAATVPSPIYSNTSSPISPESTVYPPISYQDRPQPYHSVSAPAAMAPNNVMARNAAMAFDLAPTSTPTGRISKAKKGKRVHACEFPGCGKVFTRAEHKRRHELNHNPDATFRCNYSGCNKSFHRNDLLQRHQERHELEASGASPQHRRQLSHTSAYDSPSSMPPSSMTSPQVVESAPRSSAGGITIGSLVHPPTSQYAVGPSNGLGFQNLPMWSMGEDSLVFASSSPLMDRYSHRNSISSSSSVTGFDVGSVSPMVTASMPSAWTPSSAPPNILPESMFSIDFGSSSTAAPMPIPLSDMDGYEWTIIRRELSTVPGLLSSPRRSSLSDTIRWYCLDWYWQFFHPTLPIVHRPTFLPHQPSPLLACAMVAIGSLYDQQEDAKAYSLALTEIATKILRSRDTSITSRSRIVDLQTVILLEVLSTFCARQISVQTSTRFRALFANLNQAPWRTTSPLAVFRTLKIERSSAEVQKAHKFFVEHETRSRILHACSILDNQQAVLFEQPHTVRRHLGLKININTANTTPSIPLPCDDELWEASPVEKWAEMARDHEYRHLTPGKPTSPRTSRDFSFFQHQVACSNTEQNIPKATSTRRRPSLPIADHFSNTMFNYHTSEVCKNTPIRSLLTVTGETWLLGRKVEKQADFTQAKVDVRKWLDGATAVKRSNMDCLMAHWHALKLLRGLVEINMDTTSPQTNYFGTTHMIHENWSIYLACLICWAHGHRNNIDATHNLGSKVVKDTFTIGDTTFPQSFSNTFLMDPLHAATEAEAYLVLMESQSPNSLRDLDFRYLSRTQGLLETVRQQKIGRCMLGGLMHDAEQVLFKLIEGKISI